jgi:type IV pilus assembly protein PilP
MSRRIAWGLAGALLLPGCVDDHLSDLRQYVAQVKAREPAPIDPLPEIRPVETFVYQDGNRRDPFQPGGTGAEESVAEPGSGIAPNPLRRKEELEQYPLDSIRMVGTLDQEDTMWALVLIQDGTLFRARAGNYMGQNHGQITRITEDRIDLTEIVPDGLGGWQERPASIALRE